MSMRTCSACIVQKQAITKNPLWALNPRHVLRKAILGWDRGLPEALPLVTGQCELLASLEK
uniref:Uncharacterized protein n=1 Tax=Anguilla anguilla TaxID=7936 RepID=A0A0E9R4L3_ANGAN